MTFLKNSLTTGATYSSILALLLIVTSESHGQTTLFSEGFEGDFPGTNWTVGDFNAGGIPAFWDDVDLRVFGSPPLLQGNRAAYCAGEGFAGSSFAPSYQSDMDARMQRTVNLAGATSASLTFWFNIPSIEDNPPEDPFDYCEVTVNGARVWDYDFETFGWRQATISLNAYVGGTATITFRFITDGSVQREGWYLDDILVTATGIAQPPNLTPYQPTGWSDKIVVSKGTNTQTDDLDLTPSDTLYVDWAVINNGAGPANSGFDVALYVDDVLRTSWSVAAPLPVNTYVFVSDYDVGTLAAGSHTIRIRADPAGTLAESNEADNEYTKVITVTARPTLHGSRDARHFVVSWPTNASGFILQSIGSLSGGNWTNVSATPMIIGDRYFVTNTITGDEQFYRLRK